MGLFGFLGRIAGIVFKFLWAIIPIAVRLIWAVLRIVAISLIAMFKGWLPTARDMADHWASELMKTGLLPIIPFDKYVWWVFYCLAFATLIIGWVITAYLTVFIVNLIF